MWIVVRQAVGIFSNLRLLQTTIETAMSQLQYFFFKSIQTLLISFRWKVVYC